MDSAYTWNWASNKLTKSQRLKAVSFNVILEDATYLLWMSDNIGIYTLPPHNHGSDYYGALKDEWPFFHFHDCWKMSRSQSVGPGISVSFDIGKDHCVIRILVFLSHRHWKKKYCHIMTLHVSIYVCHTFCRLLPATHLPIPIDPSIYPSNRPKSAKPHWDVRHLNFWKSWSQHFPACRADDKKIEHGKKWRTCRFHANKTDWCG